VQNNKSIDKMAEESGLTSEAVLAKVADAKKMLQRFVSANNTDYCQRKTLLINFHLHFFSPQWKQHSCTSRLVGRSTSFVEGQWTKGLFCRFGLAFCALFLPREFLYLVTRLFCNIRKPGLRRPFVPWF
jgi:hypothetical protein